MSVRKDARRRRALERLEAMIARADQGELKVVPTPESPNGVAYSAADVKRMVREAQTLRRRLGMPE